MKIKIEKGDIQISIQELIECLSDDEKLSVAKTLAVSDWFLKKATDYICDEDEDGWWTGDSAQKRHEILRRVEEKQIEKLPYFNWKPWDAIQDSLKRITSREELYWILYHNNDEEKRKWIDGCNSHYTTKTADEEIEKIKAMISDALKKMKRE